MPSMQCCRTLPWDWILIINSDTTMRKREHGYVPPEVLKEAADFNDSQSQEISAEGGKETQQDDSDTSVDIRPEGVKDELEQVIEKSPEEERIIEGLKVEVARKELPGLSEEELADPSIITEEKLDAVARDVVKEEDRQEAQEQKTATQERVRAIKEAQEERKSIFTLIRRYVTKAALPLAVSMALVAAAPKKTFSQELLKDFTQQSRTIEKEAERDPDIHFKGGEGEEFYHMLKEWKDQHPEIEGMTVLNFRHITEGRGEDYTRNKALTRIIVWGKDVKPIGCNGAQYETIKVPTTIDKAVEAITNRIKEYNSHLI